MTHAIILSIRNEHRSVVKEQNCASPRLKVLNPKFDKLLQDLKTKGLFIKGFNSFEYLSTFENHRNKLV